MKAVNNKFFNPITIGVCVLFLCANQFFANESKFKEKNLTIQESTSKVKKNDNVQNNIQNDSQNKVQKPRKNRPSRKPRDPHFNKDFETDFERNNFCDKRDFCDRNDFHNRRDFRDKKDFPNKKNEERPNFIEKSHKPKKMKHHKHYDIPERAHRYQKKKVPAGSIIIKKKHHPRRPQKPFHNEPVSIKPDFQNEVIFVHEHDNNFNTIVAGLSGFIAGSILGSL